MGVRYRLEKQYGFSRRYLTPFTTTPFVLAMVRQSLIPKVRQLLLHYYFSIVPDFHAPLTSGRVSP